MWTWRKGVSVLREKTARQDIPLSQFMAIVERKSEHAPVQVPGTAIFLTASQRRLCPRRLTYPPRS
nr:hypothetical protein [Sinorhizobium meliloti]